MGISERMGTMSATMAWDDIILFHVLNPRFLNRNEPDMIPSHMYKVPQDTGKSTQQ